jgi:hypothetical protein
MKNVAYRKRRNSRIRNTIVIGLSMILTVFVVATLVISEEITAIELLFFGIIYVIVCVPIMIMPFGNMLEWRKNGELVTYYQIGPFLFDRYQHKGPGAPRIEQDEKEDYRIAIDFDGGKKLIVEKYPTREMAQERLKDFKR